MLSKVTSCFIQIIVVILISVDTTPPTIQSCPSDIDRDIELGSPDTPVYWNPPIATDLSGNASLVSQSHIPGQRLTTGRHLVFYKFQDGSNNEAGCYFNVKINEGNY